MDNTKAIMNIPGWAEEFAQAGQLRTETMAYATVPLIYRCIRLRADALASVRLAVYKGKAGDQTEAPWPWPEMDVTQWVWNTCAALDLAGASYSVMLQNTVKRLGLQWLNPYTVTPEVQEVELPDGRKTAEVRFKRSGNVIGGSAGEWTPDEMLYIHEFNPNDDLLPGPSAAKVAIMDAGLMHYLTRFASKYFEQGAQPLTIIGIENSNPTEMARAESELRRRMTGILNAFKLIFLGGKINPVKLTSNINEMVIPDLNDQARRAIAAAFSTPQTMLEDAANYATASEHTMQFWQNAIRPRGMLIASALNAQVFKAMGLEARFEFDELDIFQADESNRAASLNQLTTAGIPLVMAMEILGYDLDDDQWAELEAKAKEKEERAQEMADNLTNKPEEEEQPEEEAQAEIPPAKAAALKKWQGIALKKLAKEGTLEHLTPFENDNIPAEEAAAIHLALVGAKTIEQVKAAFDVKVEKPVQVDPWISQIIRLNDILEKHESATA